IISSYHVTRLTPCVLLMSYVTFICTLVTVVCFAFVFFFNDPVTPEIYTLSLHDALPISDHGTAERGRRASSFHFLSTQPERPLVDRKSTRLNSSHEWISYAVFCLKKKKYYNSSGGGRSEEHTSELQSRQYHVCRLLLQKKKQRT